MAINRDHKTCPNCSDPLHPLHHNGHAVDLCLKGAFIWFEKGEVKKVLSKTDSKKLSELFISLKEVDTTPKTCPFCCLKTLQEYKEAFLFCQFCSCVGVPANQQKTITHQIVWESPPNEKDLSAKSTMLSMSQGILIAVLLGKLKSRWPELK